MPKNFDMLFFEEITNWIDDGLPVDIWICMAFNNVPHQRVILKLNEHGIRNGIINWLEQLMSDRRHMVVVDVEVSRRKPVLSRVSQ